MPPRCSWLIALVGSHDSTLDVVLPDGSVQPLHFRGLDIRRAVAQDLLRNFGLADASSVILGGTSAGGMAIYLGVDEIADTIRTAHPSARVMALPVHLQAT